MCGICAILGQVPAYPKLMEGLHAMEYRGYDSAGIAVNLDRQLHVIREKGCVSELETLVSTSFQDLNLFNRGNSGLAHTRWATNGEPCRKNAHPISSPDYKLCVVHNGVIENFQSLKQFLKTAGYTFQSDTDTEVICLLVHHLANKLEEEIFRVARSLGEEKKFFWLVACAAALDLIEGTFGLCFMFADEPDQLICAKRGSPLLVACGIKDDSSGFLVASDQAALVQMTEENPRLVKVMEEDEIVLLRYSSSGSTMTSKQIRQLAHNLRKDITTVTPACEENFDQISARTSFTFIELKIKLEDIQRGGYRHFMLKEIMSQREVVVDCLRGRLKLTEDSCKIVFSGLESKPKPRTQFPFRDSSIVDKPVIETLSSARRIVLVACGTSFHACSIASHWFESFARIPTKVEIAGEVIFRDLDFFDDDCIILVSQSGETADTREVLTKARDWGLLVFSIVNVIGSSISRDSDAGIYIHAGPEIGVASTKAFVCQLLILGLVACRVGQKSGHTSEIEARRFLTEVQKIPKKLTEVLDEKTTKLCKLASKKMELRIAHNCLFLAGGLSFPVALEGALKLKEISYIHAEGLPLAEMKHGHIALIDSQLPVFCIVPKKGNRHFNRAMANVQQVRTRGGIVFIVTDDTGLDDMIRLVSQDETKFQFYRRRIMDGESVEIDNTFLIPVPDTEVELQPLLLVVPLQLIAYYVAKGRGCAIYGPRNLAKSVTVM